VGSAYPSMEQTHSIFQARFNKDYTSHVLAIAGGAKAVNTPLGGTPRTQICMVAQRDEFLGMVGYAMRV